VFLGRKLEKGASLLSRNKIEVIQNTVLTQILNEKQEVMADPKQDKEIKFNRTNP
jgi:hypothetical protein